MMHFLANVAAPVAAAILIALLAWLGSLLKRLVGLLPVVTELVENAQESEAFRTDVDRRITAHDRQLGDHGQRLTAVEVILKGITR